MSASSNFEGESEPVGVPFYFYCKKIPGEIKLEILDGARVIYEATPEKKDGISQMVWNYSIRTGDEEQQTGERGRRSSARGGPAAGPGEYTVRLTVDGTILKKSFKVLQDVF